MLDIHSFTNTLEDLILWSGDHEGQAEPELEDAIFESLEPPPEDGISEHQKDVKKRGPSMYVTLVEGMHNSSF